MKRALWVSIATFASTSLDTNINPHDCDTLGASKLLRQKGYDVWLCEPFKLKTKLSSYPYTLSKDEAFAENWDLVIIQGVGSGLAQVLGGPWGGPNTERIVDFLMANESKIVIFLNDPRKTFLNTLEKSNGKHRAFDLFTKVPVLVPATGLLADSSREIVCEYWKNLDWDPMPFNSQNEYDCVYVGSKKQTGPRIKLLKRWFEQTDGLNCGLAGQIKVPGVKSFSDFNSIPLAQTKDYTAKSKTVFVSGEDGHTWLTPRIVQGMICGSIASISSSLAAKSYIPEDILLDQTCDRLIDFNQDLNTQAVYDRQLAFVENLASTTKPLNL